MPMQWVEPEIAVEHENKFVYHCYKDEFYEGTQDNRLEFWYTTDAAEDPEYNFDIRDLAMWKPEADHREVLRQAIDQNLLCFPY